MNATQLLLDLEEEDYGDQEVPEKISRRLVQLPDEICKGLSTEYFTPDRKRFITKMLQNDRSTMFDHQGEVLDFISEHLNEGFVLAYEASIGAGKTAAALAIAGLLGKGTKLLYACPSDQKAVRIELGQMFFIATTASYEAHFVSAEMQKGQLELKYNEHAMLAMRVCKNGEEESCATCPIEHHSVIIASTEAALAILQAHPDVSFVLFLDEFMASAGHKHTSAFQMNMKLIQSMLTRPMPQVILSSATGLGDKALDMFSLKGLATGKVQSNKYWRAWEMYSTGLQPWYLHQGCMAPQQLEGLEKAVQQPVFSRMVSETSLENLSHMMRGCMPGLPDDAADATTVDRYVSRLRQLSQEDGKFIECVCKQPFEMSSSLTDDLQVWIDNAGKTSVLLAVADIAHAIKLFEPHVAHVRRKVTAIDMSRSFLANVRHANLSKIFRGCFFKKEPFHTVWKELAIGDEEGKRLDIAILLTAGIGLFTQNINEEWPAYAKFVSERARMGHLHLLVADQSISHGVNFAISKVVVTKSILESQPPSTIFQLMGRAGRRGLSDEAKILACQSWKQILLQSAHGGNDLFENDTKNVCEALGFLGPSQSSPVQEHSCSETTASSDIDGDVKEQGATRGNPMTGVADQVDEQEERQEDESNDWWNQMTSFIQGCFGNLCVCMVRPKSP